jgi:hypothetical protein
MRVSTPLLFSAIVGASMPSSAQAGAERPVFVTVTGQSAIGFRLALGRTAPCDSSENRMLFDGTLMPGRYRFETASEIVCYQSTSASFPTSDWSAPQITSTVVTRHGPLTLTMPLPTTP